MRLLALVLSLAVCPIWTAGAVMLCQDDSGTYTPDACDLILPIDPNQRAIDCDFVTEWKWRTVGGGGDPRCVAYFETVAWRPRLMTAAERDVCNKAWDKWERVRVEEFGWSPGEPPVDQPPDFCKDLLEVPEAEIR
jgi:hypothetical protein